MTLLKMLLLFPFITLIALWQALVMFLLTYGLAWQTLKKFNKERHL